MAICKTYNDDVDDHQHPCYQVTGGWLFLRLAHSKLFMVSGLPNHLLGNKMSIDYPMMIGITSGKWQMGTWLNEVQASGL
jgi:hypothetical protein